MLYRIYNPTVTSQVVVDPYADPAGLTYTSNPSIAYYGGKFWAIFDGSTIGLYENAPGQKIWLTTSTDGQTWSTAVQPFRDSAYCNNPVGGNLDMQPNLVVVGSELWCLWNGVDPANPYISKLSSPTGKWQNYRFEFVGEQPYMSSTISGAATAGRTLYPVFDGISDWLPFMSQNPIILSDGRVTCPFAMPSYSTPSSETTATSAFVRAVKHNGLLTTSDGTNWTMARIDTSAFGDFCAWEPFVVQNPAGHIYVYSRNLNTTSADEDYLLVAVSFDNGQSFRDSVSSKMLVPSTRGFARKISSSRWMMTHCDYPALSGRTANSSTPFSRRANGALFTSLRGSNDFIPGTNFSGDDRSVNYPQFIVGPDDKLHIVYTSGVAVGLSNRRQLKHVTVDDLPSDGYGYVYPRSVNTYNPTTVERPVLKSGTPDYLYFNGRSRVESTTSLAASSGVTYTAWVSNEDGATIMDSRQFSDTAPGHIFYWAGFAISGINFFPTDWVLRQAINDDPRPAFFAATVSNTGTVNLWYGQGGATLNQATGYFKSILFSGQPADGDTLTVAAVTYTFRTTASLAADIAIGSVVSITASNTAAKLRAAELGSVTPSANRVFIANADFSVISVSSGSSEVTVESTVPVAGGQVLFGTPIAGSSAAPLAGRMYDARAYDSALTAANITNLYNAKASTFGYSTISGTSTAPASPLIHLDALSPNLTEFPDLDGAEDPVSGYCEVVSSNLLRIYGEGSASVELPHGVNELVIRYKIGATPTGTDKYTIATFGTVGLKARLYIDSDNPTSLYCNGRLVSSVANPTSYNTLTVIISTNKITIGSFEQAFVGKPRCFLGNAFPEDLLSPLKYADYDVSAMSAFRRVTA